MSLSFAAKQNIALGAMKSCLSDRHKLREMATACSVAIIEQEIGFSGEDIAPDLFTDLVSHLFDSIYEKLDELSQ
jgi:hypothetical protein